MDGSQAMVDVGGTVEPGFEGVREAFERNFVEHGEVGAGFSLVVGGHTVVDAPVAASPTWRPGAAVDPGRCAGLGPGRRCPGRAGPDVGAGDTQTSGADQVLIFDTTFGLGFMTSSPFAPYGSATSFGHAGAGGSVGFADPTNGIGFGYVMNRMLTNLSGGPRARGLVQATYEALGLTPEFV